MLPWLQTQTVTEQLPSEIIGSKRSGQELTTSDLVRWCLLPRSTWGRDGSFPGPDYLRVLDLGSVAPLVSAEPGAR